MSLRLDDVLREVPHLSARGPLDRPVAGVVRDSRQVRRDYIFVAIPGEHLEGLAFVDDALARGAAAIVAQQTGPVRTDAAWVVVENSRRALAQLADRFHGHPSGRMRVAGITGTNGKTTVSFMLRDFLRDAGETPGLIGTVQYELGARVIPAGRTTPEADDLQAMLAQMLQVGCRSAVMEVSSHALAQDRTWGIDFDAAVFTNLTRDHLDYHGTLEAYFEAKQRLFAGLGRGAKEPVAAVNADDPWGRRILAAPLRARAVSYGFGEAAQVRACDVRGSAQDTAFTLESPWGRRAIRLPLLGRFNVWNALAALATGGALGLDLDRMAGVLAGFAGVPGRLEEIPTGRGFRVFVDYAHTDDALANVLQTLADVRRGRLIAVFGCGGNRDQSKRPLMGAVAARLADVTVLTSDNPRREDPRAIIEQIRQGVGPAANYEVVEERGRAIQRALEIAQKDDIILIAGKGHERFQEFANTIVPFDDRQVVRSLLSPDGP
jgi:UDP-N-acetylmuramoyl-L-alanyl-D-glutamate--2,6-diaminopimelate ligase